MSQHAGLDNVVMWIGPDMHFVQYPIRRGELYNQVAVFRSKRYRPGTDDWGTVDELDAHYAQTCDYVQTCIKLMWRDKRWPMHDRAPILTWTRNRIGAIGRRRPSDVPVHRPGRLPGDRGRALPRQARGGRAGRSRGGAPGV